MLLTYYTFFNLSNDFTHGVSRYSVDYYATMLHRQVSQACRAISLHSRDNGGFQHTVEWSLTEISCTDLNKIKILIMHLVFSCFNGPKLARKRLQ